MLKGVHPERLGVLIREAPADVVVHPHVVDPRAFIGNAEAVLHGIFE